MGTVCVNVCGIYRWSLGPLADRNTALEYIYILQYTVQVCMTGRITHVLYMSVCMTVKTLVNTEIWGLICSVDSCVDVQYFMHNCIWNCVLFQQCRDSFRARFTQLVVYFFFFLNKHWDLKRETVQSSVEHLPPRQNVLRSLSAGKDTTLKHAVLSPLLLAVFLLCVLVHMCYHSICLFILFVCFCDVYF